MHAFPFSPRLRANLFLLLFICSAAALRAQTVTGDPAGAPTRMDEIVVPGRSVDLVGSASTASAGSVGYVELEARPFLRRGELLEVIPGVVITQHSGGGKANQYFLRGFNLDHGTDFSISVEGMPVNMRTHGHGQGYADLNFIIPEFVQGVDYTKGPFTAEVGDFSAAGAAEFRLFPTLPHAFAKLEAGGNNYARFVAGQTFVHSAKGAATTLGLEIAQDDGPWVLPEDLRRLSGIVRHNWSGGAGQEFSITALGYKAEWQSTDQVPRRAIDQGLISRFGNLDSTDGGETERASVSFDAAFKNGDATTRLNAYAIYYRLDLFSNFTFFLDDPVNGDQFNQRDRRGVFGASLEHAFTAEWAGTKSAVTVGAQVRHDAIGEVALRHTARREFISVTRDDEVRETSAGVYAKAATRWNSTLRTEAGLRGDVYHFDVESDNPVNSGTRRAAIASPKLNVVFGPWAKTEIYLSGGLGFHSNDARGTTIRIDPADGVTPVGRVNPLVRSRGFETGVRTSAMPGLVSTVSLWLLDLDSELVFVGDAGATEPAGATRRYGIEWANYYRATPWLSFDADFSLTHSRYRERAPDDRIANSIGTVVTAGVVAGKAEGLFGSVRLRYFGEQPLIEDNAVKQPSSTTVNARLGWRNREWEFAIDVLNALDRRNDDIAYFYTSRLAGEPAGGIDDKHSHPAEPRTFRASVTRRF
ncbi:MAG TPA: TonB-dependent receptor [Opitutaceae bacterium]|nr:TonB-dependent receptor [Opitutaceae bacterium]